MPNPQVDWSQAPEWAVAWALSTDVDVEGIHGQWLGFRVEADAAGQFFGIRTDEAPRFRYRGSVKNSLTLRPAK